MERTISDGTVTVWQNPDNGYLVIDCQYGFNPRWEFDPAGISVNGEYGLDCSNEAVKAAVKHWASNL